MKNPAGNKTDIVADDYQKIIDDLKSANRLLQKELDQCRKTNNVYAQQIERLKNIIEWIRYGYTRSQDAITIIDLTEGENYMKVFDMNPMALKIFNISHRDIEEGLNYKEILSEENYRTFIEEHLPVLMKGETATYKDDIGSVNGYWDSTLYPMTDKKGSISFIASISRNMTAEHENRKLSAIIQAAIDSLPFEIWIRDASGHEIYQNKTSREMSGDLVGTTLKDLKLSEEDLIQYKENATNVMNGNAVREDLVYEKDGSTNWVTVVLNPIWVDNKTIGYTTIVSDITDRKNAEISLRESEERFRLIACQSKNLLYDYDIKTGFIEWDGAIEEVTGFSPEEYNRVSFEQWAQMIHPDDKDDLLSLFERARVEKLSFKTQYRYKRKNSEYIWIEEEGNVVESSDGSPSRIIGVMRDITEQKEADEIIYKNQKLLSDSQRIAHIGSWEYYFRDDMLIWNEESYNIFGVKKTEHTPAIEDFIHLVHPDDRAMVIDHFEKTVKEDKFKDMEYRIIRPDGEERSILTVGAMNMDEKGNAFRSFGIIQDITERKHNEEKIRTSEEKLRRIFDTSKDGIVVVNRELEILEINNAALNKSGYTHQEVLNGSLDNLLSNKGIAKVKQFIKDVNTRKEYVNIEDRALIKGGDSYPVEFNINAIHLSHQDAFLLMTRDISERKLMERELLKSVITTEERERIYFSQELHDGLGPLLSAARLYIEWLADPTPDVDQGAIILDIWKILEEANKSIRDISFKLSPHTLQNYGLSDALKAYTTKVQQTAKASITIRNSVKDRFDNTIETILYRVICECINNTIKHAGARNISISIKQNGTMLSALCTDDGRGFDVEKIIETRKGIGLLNMQSRVKAVNGTLTIESTPGKGTKINICVPVKI